jgi:S-adenosylmethionine synthetase
VPPPAIGQDIKIMGLRDGNTITLTLACAMVDRYCSGLPDYLENKEILKESAQMVAKKYTNRKVIVDVNTADDIDSGSVYLTVTGHRPRWDDGSVGRGNRCNGLITQQAHEHEATSRKNPINHIRKIYNILSTQMAQHCVREVDRIRRDLHQAPLPMENHRPAPRCQHPGALTRPQAPKRSAVIEAIIDQELSEITCLTEKDHPWRSQDGKRARSREGPGRDRLAIEQGRSRSWLISWRKADSTSWTRETGTLSTP